MSWICSICCCCWRGDFAKLAELRTRELEERLLAIETERAECRERWEQALWMQSTLNTGSTAMAIILVLVCLVSVSTESGRQQASLFYAWDGVFLLLGAVAAALMAAVGVAAFLGRRAEAAHERASSLVSETESALVSAVAELPSKRARALVDRHGVTGAQKDKVLGPLAAVSRLESTVTALKNNQRFLLAVMEGLASSLTTLARPQLIGAIRSSPGLLNLLKKVANDKGNPSVRLVVEACMGSDPSGHVTTTPTAVALPIASVTGSRVTAGRSHPPDSARSLGVPPSTPLLAGTNAKLLLTGAKTGLPADTRHQSRAVKATGGDVNSGSMVEEASSSWTPSVASLIGSFVWGGGGSITTPAQLTATHTDQVGKGSEGIRTPMTVGDKTSGLPTPRVLISDTIDEEEDEADETKQEEEDEADETKQEEEEELIADEDGKADTNGMRRRAGKSSEPADSDTE